MIRLGVVGFGCRVSGVINSDMKTIAPDLQVVGIVDPNEESARKKLTGSDKEEVVFYKNLKEMVSKGKLDALAIGTRCRLHTPYAIEAAHYGLPLFLEKPVSVTMKQATDLEKAYEKAKGQVVVSFPLRVSPLCVLTRQYIEEGIGSPEHILGINYVPYGTVYFDNFYRDYYSTQGLFLQKATHDLDYMSYLMGSNIVRVGAMWTRGRIFGGKKKAGLSCSKCNEVGSCLESPQNRKRNMSGGELADHACVFGTDCGNPKDGMNEDSSSTLLEFATGVHGVYTQVFYTRRDAAARGATVSGYQGTVSFDWYKNELRRVRHHAPFSDTIKADGSMAHFGGDQELARNFINVILGREKSRTPISVGIQSAYVCLAANEAAAKGKFVNVRQVGQ
jgi:predicted dehydrogenase